MARNIELKARVHNLEAIRQRALEVATSGPEIIIQRDTFYNVPEGRLKLRELSTGIAELIYYQRADEVGPKLSTYTRTPVSDPASMHELLDRCLGRRALVIKRRELFLVSQTRIHLDEVDGLGSFMELEVVLADGQLESEGERIASDLIRTLGVHKEDMIQQAYVDLLNQTT